MLAMAPELEEAYATRFQQLHNHQSLDRPIPRFVETPFARTQAETVAAGALISSDSPLCRHDLIEIQPSPDPWVSIHRRLITFVDRIVEYPKSYNGVDPDLDATLADHAQGSYSQQGLVDCEATTARSELAVEYEPYQHLLSSVDDEGQSASETAAGTSEGTDRDGTRRTDAGGQPTAEESEAVLRTFVDRLGSLESPSVEKLYHSRAVVDPPSPKERRRFAHGSLSIIGEIERRQAATDRVVLRFEQMVDDRTQQASAELRPEDGVWRLFDLKTGSETGRRGVVTTHEHK